MQPDNPDTSNTQEWLISYSDLMSLLLCFFVMLYAISAVQETKFQTATESMRSGFGLFNSKSQSLKPGAKQVSKNAGNIILFEPGSDDLSDSAMQDLNEIYRQLLGSTDRIQIVGHAGFGEPSAYRRELDLAYSRAISVWDYLVSLGISRDHCEIVQQASESGGALVEIRGIR
jgi:flagellar motor protein MotB